MSTWMTCGVLSKYFTSDYPTRCSFSGRFLFRHGESERRRIVRQWLPAMQGIRILDAGCGDGEFLSSILSGRPKKIVIEDICSSAVIAAYQILEGKADIVKRMACNSLTAESSNFDLVLAIGVLDYYFNWEEAIKKLLLRSQECVIVSLPRSDHPRNWLRYVWLLVHGVRLHMVGRKRLTKAISSIGLPFELHQSRFEWFVRISNNRGWK